MQKMTMAFLAGILLTCGFFTTASHLDFNKSARGDISNKVATMKYTPSFHEWVQVWLKTEIRLKDTNCIISVCRRVTSRGIRWEIREDYRRSNQSPKDKKVYDDAWLAKKKVIQHQVNSWRKQGYDIAFTDFTFIPHRQ